MKTLMNRLWKTLGLAREPQPHTYTYSKEKKAVVDCHGNKTMELLFKARESDEIEVALYIGGRKITARAWEFCEPDFWLVHSILPETARNSAAVLKAIEDNFIAYGNGGGFGAGTVTVGFDPSRSTRKSQFASHRSPAPEQLVGARPVKPRKG